MNKHKNIFWQTLATATLTGIIIAIAANPPQDLALWIALFPLIFIIIAFAAEILILEALKNKTK